jgi:hypothetical protein
MSDIIRLSTGKVIVANCGIVGVNSQLWVTGGYDAEVWEAQLQEESDNRSRYVKEQDLTAAEKIELADLVIGWWNEYKQKVTEQDTIRKDK